MADHFTAVWDIRGQSQVILGEAGEAGGQLGRGTGGDDSADRGPALHGHPPPGFAHIHWLISQLPREAAGSTVRLKGDRGAGVNDLAWGNVGSEHVPCGIPDED